MKLRILLLVVLMVGCQNTLHQDIVGLWELDEVEIDALQKAYISPTFLEFKSNNSFAVSRTSGDLVGVYRMENHDIKLKSTDSGWFNRDWFVTHFGNHFYLETEKEWGRGIKLKFNKIDVIPDFAEFENKIVGKWELYKVQQNGETRDLADTYFEIDAFGNYTITDNQGLQEKGTAVINPRHHKIIFHHDKTEWRSWFYGHELRLNNDELQIQYRLRRSS